MIRTPEEKLMEAVIAAWADTHGYCVDDVGVAFSLNNGRWRAVIVLMPGDAEFPTEKDPPIENESLECAVRELAERVWTALSTRWKPLNELRRLVSP